MTWIVVRTHPNCEKIAIRNLQNQLYELYQPRILERKKLNARGFGLYEVPLFPNYLFVKINDRWMPIQHTYGVSSIITMGAKPAVVQNNIIEDLKAREDSRGFIQLPKPHKFAEGDEVIIKSGPFTAQKALVERMPVNARQKILLQLLSNQIKVLIDEHNIESE